MFMKDSIFGIDQVILDDENRFVIPSFTGVLPGEELLLYRDDGFLSIYEKEHWLDSIDSSYADMLVGFSEFNRRKYIYDYNLFDVFGCVTVDKDNRICLPKYVVDYYDFYTYNDDGNNRIFVKGAWDHINVFKDDSLSKRLIRVRDE